MSEISGKGVFSLISGAFAILGANVVDAKIFTTKNGMALENFAVQNIEVNKDLISDDKYDSIFSVEEVNKEVLKGTSFRDAYKLIGEKLKNNQYTPDKDIQHTHEGSIGNLCNEQIQKKFERIFANFSSKSIKEAEEKLLK